MSFVVEKFLYIYTQKIRKMSLLFRRESECNFDSTIMLGLQNATGVPENDRWWFFPFCITHIENIIWEILLFVLFFVPLRGLKQAKS